MTNQRSVNTTLVLITFVLITSMITSTGLSGMYAAAQSNSSSNMTSGSASNLTSSTSSSDLDTKMQQLLSSNDPKDIATLAYIWGYPLVNMERLVKFSTSPNVPPGVARGPINTFSHARDLITANYTDVVRPNADTLYSIAYLDLKKEPVVLKVPPIGDRYQVLPFLDAYTNVFFSVGTRTNDTNGGTYFIVGPTWQGKVPEDMKEIKAPTNLVWILGRTLVNGPQDVPNVHTLQDQLNLTSLSGSNSSASLSNESKEIPISPEPVLIPKTGIKIYDEISQAMADYPPSQNDTKIIEKLKTIGIGAGLKPSETKNETILNALKQGIDLGEKLIEEKWSKVGKVVNGWNVNLGLGNYGTDYLLRAAVAKFGLGANLAEEAVYPATSIDDRGGQLTGTSKYIIHFDKEQIPQVKGFWSITMYNSKGYFTDNPINRYAIGDRTQGIKYNDDGSLDIYIQHENPGKDKENNWLPAPTDEFSMVIRLYIPDEKILKGEYQIPAVQRVV